jgi:hypothetical protein
MKTPFIFDSKHKINSNDTSKVIKTFISTFPETYLGGSYSLNALGLLERYIHDIDFCLPEERINDVKEYIISENKKFEKGLKKDQFFDLLGSYPKDDYNKEIELRDTGLGEKHIHHQIGYEHIGVFFYKEREITIPIYDKFLNTEILVSSPFKIIRAKEYYVSNTKNEHHEDYKTKNSKHIKDLENISFKMSDFKMKLFLSEII